MNDYKIILLLLIVLGIGQSCSDDFLETRPSSYTNVSDLNDLAKTDPSVYNGVLNGIYATMVQIGSGGGLYDDFGQKGYDVYSDILCGDMALANPIYTDAYYGGLARLDGLPDPGFRGNIIPWRYYYRIIYQANTVIDANGGTDFVPTTDNAKYVMGQAKALRAYGYYYLSQFYQSGYDPNEVVLPLNKKAAVVNQAQAPMSEVYDLIESDLLTAIEYLDGFNREYIFQMDKDVAQGFLAYTYAAQGRYDEAYSLATDLVTNSGYVPVSKALATEGFNSVANYGDSWMWGIDVTTDMKLGLVSFWGMIDKYSYSFAAFRDIKPIDDALYNSINDTTDVRLLQFGSDLSPTGKFYNPDQTIGGSSSVYNTMDYVYMRIAEFYLLAAELAMKKNAADEAAAKNYLKQIVSLRVDDASYIDALSGQALLDEITKQTRLELWGEGKSYFLFKRNNGSRTRGTNHKYLAGETINYSQPGVSFQLPTLEILNNPLID